MTSSSCKVRKARAADYIFWLQKDLWDPTEAAILLAGFHPEEFLGGDVEYSTLAGDADAILQLIAKCISDKRLSVKNSPSDWIHWLKANPPLVLPVELESVHTVFMPSPKETPEQRRARYLEWFLEEERIKERGALQRVFERELRQYPEADRSNIGKQIKIAKKQATEAKRAGSMFGQLAKVQDGKRNG